MLALIFFVKFKNNLFQNNNHYWKFQISSTFDEINLKVFLRTQAYFRRNLFGFRII